MQKFTWRQQQQLGSSLAPTICLNFYSNSIPSYPSIEFHSDLQSSAKLRQILREQPEISPFKKMKVFPFPLLLNRIKNAWVAQWNNDTRMLVSPVGLGLNQKHRSILITLEHNQDVHYPLAGAGICFCRWTRGHGH